jgi:clathrin heavy chain
MINHSEDAWENAQFKEVIVKVANLDLFYKAVQFYIEEAPLQVNELLTVLTPRIDHARTVQLVRKIGHLPLIKPYLVSVQTNNVTAVNDALNELYVEEENFESLRVSIDTYNNFDAIALAQKLEKHELLEFRRIAAYLYKKNNRWGQSVELSKKDSLYKDALETAAESREQAIAENLLKFFVDNKNHAAFAATLYTCYDLIRPDVALEFAWRNKIIDFAFPYIIQYVRDLSTRVDDLEKGSSGKTKEGELLDKKKQKAPEGFQSPPDPEAGLDGMYGVYPGMPGAPLAIMPPPGMMPPGAYGQPQFAGQPPYGAPAGFGQPAYGGQPQFAGQPAGAFNSTTSMGGWNQGGFP